MEGAAKAAERAEAQGAGEGAIAGRAATAAEGPPAEDEAGGRCLSEP